MTVQASGLPPVSSPGLPAVNQALEPAWVRKGSASTQKAYAAALAFEQVLVQQLSQSLNATSGLSGESSEGGEAASSEEGASGSPGAGSGAGAGQLSSLLPQALSSGVMSAGGLGLAAQLTRALEPPHHSPPASASGGTRAGVAPATGGGDAGAASASGGTPA